jgi:uncharacterized integral membrane protein
MESEKSKGSRTKDNNNLWTWFKFIVGILVTLLLVYKLAVSNLSFDFSKFDFNALLALLLSLFAIGLSVAFYFKATDTSNLFYDNTYKFTKEISEILGRIEAGFGERLRHLDEGYSGLINRFDIGSNEQNIQDTKEEIEKEKQKLKQDVEERNQILNSLIEKAQLEQEEKEAIRKQLKEKEIEISKQNREVNFLRNRLHHDTDLNEIELIKLPPSVIRTLTDFVKRNNLTRELFQKYPMSVLSRKNKFNIDELSKEELVRLLNMRIIHEDGTLTINGIRTLRGLIDKI